MAMVRIALDPAELSLAPRTSRPAGLIQRQRPLIRAGSTRILTPPTVHESSHQRR